MIKRTCVPLVALPTQELHAELPAALARIGLAVASTGARMLPSIGLTTVLALVAVLSAILRLTGCERLPGCLQDLRVMRERAGNSLALAMVAGFPAGSAFQCRKRFIMVQRGNVGRILLGLLLRLLGGLLSSW